MMRRQTLLTTIALTLVAGAVLSLPGDDTSPAKKNVLKYREIYVPKDEMNELVRGLLPIKRDKFLQMIRSLDAPSETSTPAAQIAKGRYQAKFDGRQALGGTADLKVVHHVQDTVRLPLEPCGIAVGQPTWDAGQERDATLASDSDGKHVLMVDRSGDLSFPWSLRGSRSVAGVVRFDVALPGSAMNELTVELPKGLTPRVDDALVTRLDEGAETSQWLIELGGNSQFQLRLEPDRLQDDLDRAPLLRSTFDYDFSATAVTVLAELRLDVLHEPLPELSLRLDAPLTLLSASLGDQDLAFRQSEQERGATNVVLTFPQRLQGVGRVMLLAKCPLAMARSWQLPRILVEHVHWQEGSITLAVPDALSVESLTTRQCKQSTLRPLPAPRSGQLLQIQCFEQDARIELRVGHREPRVQHAAGTTVRIGGTELVANVAADFTARSSQIYALEADFPPEWIIDSVQAHLLAPDSEPADVLELWEVAAGNPRKRMLSIRLKRPIRPGRAIRVEVRGHRWLPPAEESLGISQFRFLTFRNSEATRHLICVENSPSHRFEFNNDLAANWLAPAELSSHDLELINESDDAVVLLDGKRVSTLNGVLRPGTPGYSCKIRTEATVHPDGLEEVYRIRCELRTSRLGSVIVLLSQPRDEPVQWRLQGEEEHAVAARRLTNEEQNELGFRESGFEAWEVTLRRQRIVPFTLVGQRRSALTEPTEVSVASLPDAISQTGTLVILSSGGTPFTISGTGAEAIPTSPNAPGEYSPLRAVFQYDPGKRPAISVSPAHDADQTPAAIAWACRVETRLADGRPTHIVTYLVENWGKPEISIKLPEEVSLRSLSVDGVERLSRRDYSRDEIVVSLPAGARFPTLRLVYSERKSPPLIVGRISAPKPEIDIPVLHQQWTLWLPPGLEPAGDLASAEEEYSWNDRLLGGLRRGSTDPASSEVWTTLLAPLRPGSDGAPDTEAVVESFDKALAEVTSQRNGQAARWGDLLVRVESLSKDPDSDEGRTILVDAFALAQLGIHPVTRLPTQTEDTASLLAQSNLVLVLRGGRCLVTARVVAAMNGDRLEATSRRSVLTDQTGAFRGESPFDSPGSDRFLPVATWNTAPALPQSPWQLVASTDYAGIPAPGWTAYQIDGIGGAELSVRVQRGHAIRAFGWGAFILSSALGWWLACGRPSRLVLLIGLAGCAALTAPEFYAGVATKLFLGSLFAIVLVVAWRPRGSRPVAATAETASRVARATAVVLFCLLSSWIALAMADDAPRRKPPASTVYPVVIPVNEDEQPTDEVYVAPEFYKALHKLSEPGSQGTWLMESAKYDCRLEWASVGKRLDVVGLSATYVLDVLDAAQVVLPVSSKELHLLPDRATLDGQPVAADWTQDGNGLVVQVSRPGTQRLELAFRPVLQRAYRTTGFDVGIPPNARSQLSLSFPEGAPRIEIPTALGISTTGESGQPQYQLGPANRLAVQWATPRPDDGAAAGLAVEELQWLRVDPGSTVINTRFRFVVPRGQTLRNVELAVDPRLQIQIRDNQPVRVKQVSERLKDGLQRIELELKEPAEEELTFSAAFSLAGAAASGPSGVGTLRLPQIYAIADQRLRRWLAVSVNPAFEFEYDKSVLEEIAGAEFVRNWGNTATVPQLALRLSETPTAWDLRTRPRPAEITAHERLDFSIGQKDTEVTYTGDVTIGGGSQFQLQLRAPKNLRIDEISIVEDNIQRVASWSRGERQTLHVFLNSPLTGRHEIRLRGEMPIRVNRPVTLPRITAEHVNVETQEFRIYRRHDVLLRVQASAGVVHVEDDEALGRYTENLGWLWAVFEAPPADGERAKVQPAVTFALQPNRPFDATPDRVQPECVVITTLHRDDDVWTADVECELRNIQGIADTIRLRIPTDLQDLVNVATKERLEAEQTAGHNRQDVLVRSPESVAGDCRFHIRGTLTGQPIVAPDVFPIDFAYEAVTRYLILPTHADLRKIEWDVNGLRDAFLARDYGEPVPTSGDYLTYLVTSPDGRASVRNVRAAKREPQVHLADIRYVMAGDEKVLGMAMFDLEPTDLESCILELPEGASPIQTFVGGLPVTLDRRPGNRWAVRLGLSHMPQRIEAIYRAGDDIDSGSPSLLTPDLVGIPVLNQLWTVHDISKSARSGGNARANQELELQRLKVLGHMFGQAADSVKEHPQEHVDNWYRRWASRTSTSFTNLQRLGELEGWSDEIAQEDVDAIEAKHAEIAASLNAANIRSDALNSSGNSSQCQDLWNILLPINGTTHHAIGQLESVEQSLSGGKQRQWSGGLFARAGVGGAFLGLMVALYFLLTRGRLGEWLTQFSHAAGVLAGLAWCLWLTPSIVGFIIVGVSVVLATRPQGVRMRDQQ